MGHQGVRSPVGTRADGRAGATRPLTKKAPRERSLWQSGVCAARRPSVMSPQRYHTDRALMVRGGWDDARVGRWERTPCGESTTLSAPRAHVTCDVARCAAARRRECRRPAWRFRRRRRGIDAGARLDSVNTFDAPNAVAGRPISTDGPGRSADAHCRTEIGHGAGRPIRLRPRILLAVPRRTWRIGSARHT